MHRERRPPVLHRSWAGSGWCRSDSRPSSRVRCSAMAIGSMPSACPSRFSSRPAIRITASASLATMVRPSSGTSCGEDHAGVRRHARPYSSTTRHVGARVSAASWTYRGRRDIQGMGISSRGRRSTGSCVGCGPEHGHPNRFSDPSLASGTCTRYDGRSAHPGHNANINQHRTAEPSRRAGASRPTELRSPCAR